MQEKTNNTRQQACWKLKDTSDQNPDKWSVSILRRYRQSQSGTFFETQCML